MYALTQMSNGYNRVNMRTFHSCSYISLPLSQALQQVHKYVEVAGMGADLPVHDPHECVPHFKVVFLS